ncbi:hypothetical protein, partial [Acinetobacter baumannii]|uniref:hypothetical protein n=1 Tax=Acinetobacter baumannii TaxID=470 RepID=UPI001BC86FA1
VRGAEPMEKRQRRGLSFFSSFDRSVFSSFSMHAPAARRSRTTERSESVSEEAEERLDAHFLLTHL